MAISKDNYVTNGLKGAVGKDFVFKQFNGKTIVTKYPDRSQVKYNKKQTRFQKIFAEATAYASDIINDPVKKAAYKVGPRKSVFHAAIKDYMALHAKKVLVKKLDISPWLQDTRLNIRQKKAIKYLSKNRNISNAVYQKLGDVSKPTATRDLQELVRLNIITPPVTRGAGAFYTLVIRQQEIGSSPQIIGSFVE
jgi:predicted HTH transcriptional regulator